MPENKNNNEDSELYYWNNLGELKKAPVVNQQQTLDLVLGVPELKKSRYDDEYSAPAKRKKKK